ncbi:MAG: hypothetical protein JRH20_26700, partial [Deltaproteobacteria bacterium]|nr:hypothetical protein [Deltaproteobacteria bacterium]
MNSFRALVIAFFLLAISTLYGCTRYGFTEPCATVSCSGHGSCELVDGRPECRCDSGFHNLGPLVCAWKLPQELLASCGDTLAEDVLYSCLPTVLVGDHVDDHLWGLGAAHTCHWLGIDPLTALISGTPDDDDVGACILALVADQGSLAPRSASLTLTITNVRPTLSLATQALIAQDAGATQIYADQDVVCSDEGHGIYSMGSSVVTDPCDERGALSIDASTGALTYTPDAGFNGRCGGSIAFDDENGVTGTASVTFEVDVLPLVGFGQESSAVDESTGYHWLRLTLSGLRSAPVTIPYVVSGSASGGDHTLEDGSWTIPAGQTSATVQVRILDDLAVEGDETLVVTLQQPIGAALGQQHTHSIAIMDNDLPQLDGVVSIAAGHYSMCAQKQSGAVYCWGDNSHSVLGNGTTLATNTPVLATNLGTEGRGLSLGLDHGCGIFSGEARCWGYNQDGKLGDGTTTDHSSPVAVTGLTSGVTFVGAGAFHSCALVSGGVWCWGRNSYGQLGDGTTTRSTIPVQVSGLQAGVVQLAVGDSHACAVLNDASVRCWGLNTRRQLGNDDNVSSSTPVTPVGLTGASVQVVDVSLGYDHSCARLSTGALKCWGWDTQGQLGVGDLGGSGIPTDVVGLTGVKQVSLRGQVWGGGASCALTASDGVMCWGTNTA